ncbi:MAG: pyridoxamine 5-phosphate oxidase, partial [Paracoccaceae bacterium]
MTKADTAYLPPDDQARATIAALYYGARTAALAFVHPDTTAPFVSRIAFLALSPVRAVTLISSLSLHYMALQKDPRAAVLLGETANKGDPLNGPRLSLS